MRTMVMTPVRNRQVIIHEALLAQTETNFFVWPTKKWSNSFAVPMTQWNDFSSFKITWKKLSKLDHFCQVILNSSLVPMTFAFSYISKLSSSIVVVPVGWLVFQKNTIKYSRKEWTHATCKSFLWKNSLQSCFYGNLFLKSFCQRGIPCPASNRGTTGISVEGFLMVLWWDRCVWYAGLLLIQPSLFSVNNWQLIDF